MSELAADLLVPVSTPAEVDSQLGALKVTRRSVHEQGRGRG